MTQYVSAQKTAERLGFSKTYIIDKANAGEVSPAAIKVPGRNGQWLFSPHAKLIKKTLDKRKPQPR